ncbi:MAG: T9SS type A sorting domain-containing protein, partial [Bacteroidota bacterium]
DIGDLRKSPGWRFFEDTQVTQPQSDAVKVRFDVRGTNTYMHLFAPAGITREYTKALGPATREANNGYVNKKTQIIAIRQTGEAWDQPFVHIFEPTNSTSTSVQSVEYLYRDEVVVGAIVNSQVGDKTFTDYVISQEDNTQILDIPELKLKFQGRFAVVRREQDTEKAFLTLYIGEGESLTFEAQLLEAGADKKGLLKTEVARITTDVASIENNKGIKVFPNPGRELISLSLKGFKSADINIFDATGRLIQSIFTRDQLLSLPLENIQQPGIYFIKVIDENQQIFHQKFIVN